MAQMEETPVSRSVLRRLAEQLDLTEAQLDGRACFRCGSEHEPMVPAATVNGIQVFECAAPTAECPIERKAAAFGRWRTYVEEPS